MKKIDKLTISNFRNITKAEYILGDRTAIKGKNHIGKTNALQAAYWLLTDSMLENTNDFDTIVPHADNRALTEVKITFDDGTTFGKTYREKWTKTRGNDTESLTGHETNYFVNGVLYKTKAEAMLMLKDILFGAQASKSAMYPSINLAKALINPLYLFGQEEWKNARQFIIQLVGSIKDEDIFSVHPEYVSIRADLAQLNGHTDMLAKKYADSIKSLKAQMATNESNIDFVRKKMDENNASQDDAKKATSTLESIKRRRAKLESDESGNANPAADAISGRIKALNLQKADLENEIAKDESNHFEEYTRERQNAMNEYQKQCNKADELTRQINELQNKTETVKKKMEEKRQEIELAKQKKERLRQNYAEIKAREFKFTETVCPHCGAVLNDAEEEKARQDFENRKNGDAVDCVARGRAAATEISRLEAELDAFSRQLAESSDSAIAQMQNELSSACQKRDIKRQALNSIVPYKSPRRNELENLKARIQEENNNLIDAQGNMRVTKLERLADFDMATKAEREEAQAIIDKATIFKNAQADFENLKCEKTIINHNLTSTEEKKETLKQFILAKLAMTNAKTKTVFPDIEFVLIEPNIKEGSFNEVCYPLIKGKKTQFVNGSNSERILTGIAIINDIRKALEIEPMTIIFDEGETLDSESINSIETDSQILTSMVDDAYAEPTAVLIR